MCQDSIFFLREIPIWSEDSIRISHLIKVPEKGMPYINTTDEEKDNQQEQHQKEYNEQRKEYWRRFDVWISF